MIKNVLARTQRIFFGLFGLYKPQRFVFFPKKKSEKIFYDQKCSTAHTIDEQSLSFEVNFAVSRQTDFCFSNPYFQKVCQRKNSKNWKLNAKTATL